MLANLMEAAEVIGVVVRNGVVIHAPDERDLGRNAQLTKRGPY